MRSLCDDDGASIRAGPMLVSECQVIVHYGK